MIDPQPSFQLVVTIVPRVSQFTGASDAARLKLSDVVLMLARNGFSDSQTLTQEAVNIILADPAAL